MTALALAAAACAGGPGRGAGDPPPVAGCAGTAALEPVATALQVAPAALSSIECVPLAHQFERWHWLDGAGSDDGAPFHWRALVRGGEARWVERLDVEQFGELVISDRRALDLDADQTDELAYVEQSGDPACGAADLVVVGIAGAPPRIERTLLSSWCTGQPACDGTWRGVAGGVEVSRSGECGEHPAHDVLRWAR